VGGYGKFKNRPAYTGFGTPHRQEHINTNVLFCIGAERVKESEAGPTTVEIGNSFVGPYYQFSNFQL